MGTLSSFASAVRIVVAVCAPPRLTSALEGYLCFLLFLSHP